MIKLTVELKTKARDLNFTLVTFWILLAVKCPLESISKPYGRATAMPTAWGLSFLLFKLLQPFLAQCAKISFKEYFFLNFGVINFLDQTHLDP